MPSFLQTTLLKIRYGATGNKVDDFAAIQAATAQDVDSKIGPAIFLPGDLKASAAAAAPAGWLLCDGSAVSRVANANLFAAIGVTYGAGDGSTTFNLPDYRGRTIVGAGAGAGLTNRPLGSHGGEETHGLSVAEMPSHAHGVSDPGHSHYAHDAPINPGDAGWAKGAAAGAAGGPFNANYAGGVLAFVDSSATGIGITNAGGGAAHNNMQPFGTANVFIKT